MDELIQKFMDAQQLVQYGALDKAKVLYQEIIDSPHCPSDFRITVTRELQNISSVTDEVAIPEVPTPTSTKPAPTLNMVDPFAIKLIEDVAQFMPITDTEYNEIKRDIQARGIQTPLIVTPDYRLLCGYNRLKIAKELDLKYVPVIFKDIKEKDILTYAMLDNIRRRQLTRDQVLAYIGNLPVPRAGRPSKRSRRKVDADIGKALGLSARSVRRARSYARKLKDNPELIGKSIRSVLGGEDRAHAVQTYEYTIGVDDEKMASDFVGIMENLFNFDIRAGDRLKLVIQAFHLKRG